MGYLIRLPNTKSFSLTVADSLTSGADKLAGLIGIDSDVRIVNPEPSNFLMVCSCRCRHVSL